ncbi:DUF1028 domain-containing protein [Rhodococcus hoagii]|nr:DUF1028 domain-containing protein [Prescottella equi]
MTYSVVARCDRTGQLGVATATSLDVAVGARVPWLRTGVGAVVTQHRTDPRLGPRLLDLMAAEPPPPRPSTACGIRACTRTGVSSRPSALTDPESPGRVRMSTRWGFPSSPPPTTSWPATSSSVTSWAGPRARPSTAARAGAGRAPGACAGGRPRGRR